MQLLQAYHEKYLKDNGDRTEFYLDWNLWMHVTHKGLLAFDILSKKKDKFSDDFDREHHIGKYWVKHKVNFDKTQVKEPPQEEPPQDEDVEYGDTDPDTDTVEPTPHQTHNGDKSRDNHRLLKSVRKYPNAYKELKEDKY